MRREKKLLPIKSTYRLDTFLMYLIRDVTKRPSADILNFFYELAGQISEIGMAKRTGSGIDKKLVDYFPGTSIPFHMRVKGHPRSSIYDSTTRTAKEYEHFAVQVEVGFPDQMASIKEEKLAEIAVGIMERALLDGGEVEAPEFVKPEIRSPKMYKSLMDSFAGRPVQERKTRKKKEEQSESIEPAR